MSCMKVFICVTSIYDGRKAYVRASCIEGVSDNAEEILDFGVKPAHRSIVYSGVCLDVRESIDEIMDMIFNAEL